MAYNDAWLPNVLAYCGLRTIGALLNQFEIDRCMATAGAIGDWWYRRDERRRNRALDAVRSSFPELDDKQANDLVRRSMRSLLQLFTVEVIYTPRLITTSTWMNYVRFGNVDEALQVLTGRRPALFVTAHCGNFELLGFTLATVGFRLNAVARPLDLPMIDDWLLGVRERRGMRIITKFGVIKRLPDLIEAGENVSFTGDQNAGDRGLFVPFFGRLASAYKSIGLLAMRFDIPIVCGHSVRTAPDRFQYEIHAADVIYPDDWNSQPDPLFYITARYTRAIEAMVRAAPEQYFWVHRRWKSRPRHERLGRRMPSALREKIASLPWMNDTELERITANSEREAAANRT